MTGSTMPNFTPALVTGGVPQVSAYKDMVVEADRQNNLVNAVGGSKLLVKKKSNKKKRKSIRKKSRRAMRSTRSMRSRRLSKRRKRRIYKGGDSQAYVYTAGTPQQQAIQTALAQNMADHAGSSAGAKLVRPSI